jgi:hypothetical protein
MPEMSMAAANFLKIHRGSGSFSAAMHISRSGSFLKVNSIATPSR